MQPTGSRTTRPAGASRIPIAVLDALLSRELRSGPVEDRRRARLIVSVSLGMFVVSVYMSAFAAMAGESRSAAFANLGFTLVSLLLAFSLRMGVPLRIAALLPLVCFLVGGLSLTLITSGDYTAVILALTALPLMSMVMAGRRATLFFTGAVFAGVAATWWLNATGYRFPYTTEPAAWEAMRFPFILTFLCWTAALSLIFEWLRGHALLEARRSRIALEASEARYRGIAEHAGEM